MAWRGVEVPAKAEVKSHFGRRLPLVACKSKEPPLPIGREEGVEIATRLARLIEQETGNVIRDIGLRTRLRGLGFGEGERAARAERLVLQKVIADSAKVNTEFDGVIADDLGPVIYEINV